MKMFPRDPRAAWGLIWKPSFIPTLKRISVGGRSSSGNVSHWERPVQRFRPRQNV